MDATTFGAELKRLRAALDLTQSALAARVGCAIITLKQIEGGRRRPSRQIAERLAETLQVPPVERERFVRRARQQLTDTVRTNPYRGLAAFDEHDRGLFFGREAMIDMLLSRLRATDPERGSRILPIVGPSGCGKSSLLRAGLLPALREGALPGSEHWPVVVFTPGSDPLAALDRAHIQLAHGRRIAGRILAIDQFEEVFTLGADADLQANFLRQIGKLATDAASSTWILLTLRADYFDRPLHDRTFGALLCAHAAFVLPLTPAEIEQAVIGPAKVAGVVVEPALVATLIADLDGRPGALPLLQYVLTELFELEPGQRLTLAAYHTLGGAPGIIARRANALFTELSPDEQMTVRQIFLRLVQPGDVPLTTRRPVPQPELDALPLPTRPAPLLERFARARLLTLDRDSATGVTTAAIAHEVLIDTWPTLREWLAAHHGDLVIYRQLARAATDWHEAGEDHSYLASGMRLAQYVEVARQSPIVLSPLEQAFVATSTANAEHELREAHARQEYLQASLRRTEALRLAAESNRLRLAFGSAEVIALLALRSIELCYTPQGDEALTAALLLDLPTRSLRGHAGRIYSVAYAPDGHTIATGGQDRVIRLWDVPTGVERGQLAGHTGLIRLLTFSTDGNLLASLGDDRTVRVWCLSSGAVIRTFVLPNGGLEEVALAFAPDGRRLLCGGEYETMTLWDVTSGAVLRTLPVPGGVTHWVAFLADGDDCLVLAADGLYAWDLVSGRARSVMRQPKLMRAALLNGEERQRLATVAGTRLEVWDLATTTQVAAGTGHTEPIEAIITDRAGHQIATVGNDGTARVWDAATCRETHRFVGHSNLIWAVAFAPDGETLLTGGTDGQACLWDIRRRVHGESVLSYPAPVHAVVMLPNGRSMITGSADRLLCLWDLERRAVVRTFAGMMAPAIHGSIACAVDGSLVAGGSDDGIAYLWDVASGQLVRRFVGHRGRIWGCALAPGNRVLLTVSSDQTARLWDIATGEALHTLQGHTNLVVGACFTPDGRSAVTASDDGTVRLWDTVDGRELQRVIDPSGPMMQVDVHPDGRHILTGSADGSVRLWELRSGQIVKSFVGHQGYIYSAIFSADGCLALTCAADRTARLWNVDTGKECRRLIGHTSAVFDATLTPNGAQIITCSYDRTVRFWAADYRHTAAALRRRLLRDFTEEERQLYSIPVT
jgi:WD40 repeat protein/transcriptional regulator with XRE-family HTH domain